MSEQPTGTCSKCGREHTPDEDGWATCYGRGDSGPHTEVVIFRPCGICGDPIRTAEICRDCADEHEGDAFTTNWGSGLGVLDDG